jgi:hypothetical protein
MKEEEKKVEGISVEGAGGGRIVPAYLGRVVSTRSQRH